MEKHLGSAIKGWIKSKGMSQKDVAQKIGIAPETFSRKLREVRYIEDDASLIKLLIYHMPDLENLMREFAAPGALESKPPVNEVDFLRRENSALKLALEETEARAERLLRVVETLAAKQNQNQH